MKTKNFIFMLALIGLLFSACVKDEIFQGPPSLSEMNLTPQSPSENQAVTVSVKVTDMNGVKTVTLYYKVGSGSFQPIVMTGSNNVYTAQIPGQDTDASVLFYIEAENKSGKKAYHPAGAPATTASFTVGAPLILMNEIYSRGVPDNPDWIEIYNASDVAVDIGGYKIYDNGGQAGSKPKIAIPAGTIISAKGFYVVVTDIGGDTGFGLSSGGEEVWFENDKGNVIDNLAFPAMDVTQSYGRNPDGAQTWQLLNTITRGAPNSAALPEPVVKLNEIFSQGTAENPDWIELYNESNFEANIGGYKIYDNDGQSGSKPKKEIPAGTVIPAKGFYVIVVDDGTANGFGLSGSGEQVWLENTTGVIKDDITFPALEATQSYGRYPDGTANWQVLHVVTKGTANDNTIPPPPAAPVKMNEIYSRGTVENPDWIEIYNPSTTQVDISGFKVYDSGGNAGSKPKKEFPAGTVIPAGGFFAIVVDDGELSGFGLSSGGEKVWFENAGGVVIDSIVFPAMEETQSYGRLPDGSDNWQLLNTITKGASNSNAPPATFQLVHYWHFNALPSGTLTDPVVADFTATGVGAAVITYPGTGAGYMDQVSPGSTLNLQMSQEAGLGLRPRNPANTRELLFVVPSTNFDRLVVTFATMRSSNGAAQQEFYYSANGGTDWVKVGEAYDIALDWELKTVDLSAIPAVNNNAGLQFKILFVGAGSDGSSGNNRFDNITVQGYNL